MIQVKVRKKPRRGNREKKISVVGRRQSCRTIRMNGVTKDDQPTQIEET